MRQFIPLQHQLMAFTDRRLRLARPSIAVRYGSALGIVLLATLLRTLLAPWIEPAGFAISLLGMLAAAWVGGLEASLLSQTVVLVIESLWFKEPTAPREWQFSIRGLISIASFYAVGIVVALLREAVDRARARSRAREHLLRATLQSIGEGMLISDLTGRVIFANKAAQAFIAKSSGEIIGHSLSNFLKIEAVDVADPQSLVAHLLRDPLDASTTPEGMLLGAEEGRPVSYIASAIRTDSHELSGVVVVFRDETERKRHEQALREADRRKDEYLATLAHELRNPLAPICNGLEIMKLAALDPAASEELRGMMERQAKLMVRLIDDLLDVSRITRGKLELRMSEVLLADVLRSAAEAARPLAEGANLSLHVHLPAAEVRVRADSDRLTQILMNLLSNAIKFTPPEGRIDLRVDAVNGVAQISVTDTGIGIPLDRREYIFELFTQLKAETSVVAGGLGIGLTLVKRLVEMHGGSVVAGEGPNGRGSAFTVSLPLLPPEVDLSPTCPETRAASQPASRRVLVVDDNADALDSLALIVRLMGHEVERASDGVEAVTTAEHFRPEVILMDLGMPRMDGFEAARCIRHAAWGRDLLLVATSGWGQAVDRDRSRAAGFDRHLVKPVNPEELRALFAGDPPGSAESTSCAGRRHAPPERCIT
jgi:PAS domain S-box-containing protein